MKQKRNRRTLCLAACAAAGILAWPVTGYAIGIGEGSAVGWKVPKEHARENASFGLYGSAASASGGNSRWKYGDSAVAGSEDFPGTGEYFTVEETEAFPEEADAADTGGAYESVYGEDETEASTDAMMVSGYEDDLSGAEDDAVPGYEDDLSGAEDDAVTAAEDRYPDDYDDGSIPQTGTLLVEDFLRGAQNQDGAVTADGDSVAANAADSAVDAEPDGTAAADGALASAEDAEGDGAFVTADDTDEDAAFASADDADEDAALSYEDDTESGESPDDDDASVITISEEDALTGEEETEEPDEDVMITGGSLYRSITGEYLNIRANPGADNPVIGQIDPGDICMLMDDVREEGWIQILYVDDPEAERVLTGWVSEEYVEEISLERLAEMAGVSLGESADGGNVSGSSTVSDDGTGSPDGLGAEDASSGENTADQTSGDDESGLLGAADGSAGQTIEDLPDGLSDPDVDWSLADTGSADHEVGVALGTQLAADAQGMVLSSDGRRWPNLGGWTRTYQLLTEAWLAFQG